MKSSTSQKFDAINVRSSAVVLRAASSLLEKAPATRSVRVQLDWMLDALAWAEALKRLVEQIAEKLGSGA